MNTQIPRILHQTWRTLELPPQFTAWHTRWKELHPAWEHRFYDDETITRIVRERAPQWLQTYETLPRNIQRLDFFRYLIVYMDGGLYADIDMVPYQACDPLLTGAGCVFVV